MFVGVDIGGTFTDLVVAEGGSLRLLKRLSTPANPAAAMLAGLAELGAMPGEGPGEGAERIAHGSTVATNAILERKGARTALLTTHGLRDVLAIGRQARPVLYALQPQLPPPLIPPALCFEARERLDHAGNVLEPLDLADLDAQIAQMRNAGIESLAICFLYSFVNPSHEYLARDRIVASELLPAERIALSCEVLREFREYERASTVALDAYVRPVIGHYLGALEAALDSQGTGRLLIMRSDGGLVRAATARRQAIQTALSGPAAGAIGAAYLARRAGDGGWERVITLDIGGTSTDVALIAGTPTRRTETEIDGLPLRIPMIDIVTVGAGGGSIARLDAGGALRVGPESAGASPGPVAYGQGGTAVTVTDAHVALGRLDPDHFLGGAMMLDDVAARAAIADLAVRAGMAPRDLAQGIVTLADAHIDRAVRRVSIERGQDPRSFALMAFGGAGPLHACDVAVRLGIGRVLLPEHPGVLCALGLLVADIQRTYSRTMLRPATPEAIAELRAVLEGLIVQAQADLAAEGIAPGQMALQGALDLRYRGQSYELTVPFSDDPLAGFHAAHAQRYGYARPERAVEAVTLRLEATGLVAKPNFTPEAVVPNDGTAALLGTCSVWSGGADRPARLYERARLRPGASFPGPALICQYDSTTWVPDGWQVAVDGYRNMLLT